MDPQAMDRQVRMIRTVLLADAGLAAVGAALYEVVPALRPALTEVGGPLLLLGVLALAAVRLLSDFGYL